MKGIIIPALHDSFSWLFVKVNHQGRKMIHCIKVHALCQNRRPPPRGWSSVLVFRKRGLEGSGSEWGAGGIAALRRRGRMKQGRNFRSRAAFGTRLYGEARKRQIRQGGSQSRDQARPQAGESPWPDDRAAFRGTGGNGRPCGGERREGQAPPLREGAGRRGCRPLRGERGGRLIAAPAVLSF